MACDKSKENGVILEYNFSNIDDERLSAKFLAADQLIFFCEIWKKIYQIKSVRLVFYSYSELATDVVVNIILAVSVVYSVHLVYFAANFVFLCDVFTENLHLG